MEFLSHDVQIEAALSYEIIYTSSPRGLKDGDRGFCTVAATAGIPRLLQEKLESLSGYRHAFSPPSEFNPVNYSYQIIRIQKEPWFILSRIADAGVDFSGRSNLIAHHLAMSADDIRAARSLPSALLADPDFWMTAWDREPSSLPEGRLPSPHPCGGARGQTWTRTFGDAGWAGLLARGVQNDFEPVSIIVPEDCNSLALVNEAMRLVAARDRWKVCFSTYFIRSTAGSDCHWRFVLDGTDEATSLRDRPNGTVVDPRNSRRPLPDDDPFVAAARGVEVAAAVAAAAVRDDDEPESVSRRPVTRSQLRRRQAGERARRARLGTARPVRREPRETRPRSVEPEIVPSNRWQLWLIAAVGVIVVSVVSIAIVWIANAK